MFVSEWDVDVIDSELLYFNSFCRITRSSSLVLSRMETFWQLKMVQLCVSKYQLR